MKKIKLTQNKYALVDDKAFEELNKFKWHFHNGYAIRTVVIPMPKAIMGLKNGLRVDHINGNRLDNRKSNLRFATTSQNAMNTELLNTNTSGFRGVDLDKRKWRKNKWRARITVKGKENSLGYWSSKEAAALARKLAERKYFGDYMRRTA